MPRSRDLRPTSPAALLFFFFFCAISRNYLHLIPSRTLIGCQGPVAQLHLK